MNIKRAREITRNYIREGKELSPVIASDWSFSKINNKIYIQSETIDISSYFSTVSYYVDNFIFNEHNSVSNNKLNGSFYLTSIGLINEDEFYQAETMIERYNTKIKEKDLVIGDTYVSNKGKKYIYIGKIKQKLVLANENTLYKEIIETDSFLFDINKKSLVKSSSIKLVNTSSNLDLPFNIKIKNIDYSKYINENFKYNKLIYRETITEINGSDVFYSYINRIDSYLDNKFEYNTLSKVNEFIHSNKKDSLKLIRKRRNESEIHTYRDGYGNLFTTYTDSYGVVHSYQNHQRGF